jgi:antirestriction protein
MQTKPDTSPAVYVSTYKKYNEGSLKGVWVDLNKFQKKADFLDYCYNVLFQDEDHPELMYQDWEFISPSQISECSIDENLFAESLPDWLCEHERELVKAYRKDIDPSAEPQDILDRYVGSFSSVEDYVDDVIESMGINLPDWLIVDRTATYENNLRFDLDVTEELHFFQNY